MPIKSNYRIARGCVAATAFFAALVGATSMASAEPRRAQTGACAEGFTETATRTENGYHVYECRQFLRCAPGYKADQHEFVDEKGYVVEQYRCSALDKSQIINMPGTPSN